MSILENKDTFVTHTEPLHVEPLKNAAYPTTSSAFAKKFKRRILVRGTLALGDVMSVFLSVPIAQAISSAVLPVELHPISSLPALTVIGFYAILGLYAEWGLSAVERLRIRALGSVAYFAINAILAVSSGVSIAALSNAASIAVILFFIGHYVDYLVRTTLVRWKIWGAPTVLIGSGLSQELAKTLLAQPDYGLRPIAIISDQLGANGPSGRTSIAAVTHINEVWSLDEQAEVALVTKERIDKVDSLRTYPFDHIILVHNTSGELGLGIHVREAGDRIGSDLKRGIYKRHNLIVKRLFDLAVSVPLAILTAPITLILLLAIKIIDPGPGLFWQSRIGQNGRTIKVCKLRTMYLDAEQQLEKHLANCPKAHQEWNTHFKLQNDPRILPVIGTFIRRYSLDELPQIINVVQGNMSLVGPRPFPEYHLKSFDKKFQDLRASVPPGLTGFWQISARSDGNLAVQKMQDTLYIQNWSPWLDLWILLQTIPAVLAAKGAR